MGNFDERSVCCGASICESLCHCAEQAGPGTMVPVGCHGDSGVTPPGGQWGGRVRLEGEGKKTFTLSLPLLKV